MLPRQAAMFKTGKPPAGDPALATARGYEPCPRKPPTGVGRLVLPLLGSIHKLSKVQSVGEIAGDRNGGSPDFQPARSVLVGRGWGWWARQWRRGPRPPPFPPPTRPPAATCSPGAGSSRNLPEAPPRIRLTANAPSDRIPLSSLGYF
jgi:hypothetical protein